MSNKDGLKVAIALVDNRRAEIKKDLDVLNNAKKLLGEDAITNKYVTLVDALCELTLLKGGLMEIVTDEEI